MRITGNLSEILWHRYCQSWILCQESNNERSIKTQNLLPATWWLCINIASQGSPPLDLHSNALKEKLNFDIGMLINWAPSRKCSDVIVWPGRVGDQILTRVVRLALSVSSRLILMVVDSLAAKKPFCPDFSGNFFSTSPWPVLPREPHVSLVCWQWVVFVCLLQKWEMRWWKVNEWRRKWAECEIWSACLDKSDPNWVRIWLDRSYTDSHRS